MPTPNILNIEELLKEIPGGSPAGPDLRVDFAPGAIYQQIRDARETSRNVERQIQQKIDGYSPDQLQWKKVLELGTGAIGKQSKDLGIAAWICEALVRQHGFAGLRDGFKLARKLVDEYWTGLYPQPEVEEGIEPPSNEEKIATRVTPLEGLFSGALTIPINAVELTEEGFSFADYRQAKDLDKETDKATKQMKMDQGAATVGQFSASVANSSNEFYQTLHDDLAACVDEFTRLSKTLDAKCGKDAKGFSIAPATGDTEKLLKGCLDIVKELGKQKGLFQEPPKEGEAGADGGALQKVGVPGENGRREFSREDAFRQLLVLAEFFRRSEPHSPISHHIEEAVRWGRMDLSQLLAELITDEKMRQAVFTRVGIPEVLDEKAKKK